MKHLITLHASLHVVIADDEARLCWQLPLTVWQQVNIPERVYLAALDSLRWVGGWIPRGADWRAAWRVMVGGGEYWKVIVG